jgi:hypothetical protein
MYAEIVMKMWARTSREFFDEFYFRFKLFLIDLFYSLYFTHFTMNNFSSNITFYFGYFY